MEQDYKNEVSKLAKDLHRVKMVCTAFLKSNEARKQQIERWNTFFQKLIKEGRITKEELKEYSPRKKGKQEKEK